ncbi:hypothetical protein EPa61_29 [Pseudomonas phage EPa61]|jgi:hypothetical protein|uniref:Uncharacterized protein n=24 Tax=root TaxID=1 RepID=A0A6M4ERX1_9CAUD|nr:hypothetical protein PB1_gp71 [Pseudomonas phage PB1]YP_009833326.1 phage protein [Pseudomonas phage R26]YP_009842837.1 hypothetical protein HWC00_gp29 [Pseudomonas phage EPa61]YP_009913721.1 hypothetical protein H6S65_gp63 [Pseudomonas phage datas]YP_009913826.1 hypothetical protein H6S66_gp79 [Pseudomonas phage Epa14]YP_009914361.1 hypothetical protein H6S71_gp67 [Pseudomonas phage antinowhere]YP_009914453.1 hypothetical protein H6S73_gp67 [Pseudomonas phage crassa]YP_009967052.1 hypoth
MAEHIFTHEGTVVFEGRSRTVKLRRGNHHWVDPDRHRYSPQDGRAASQAVKGAVLVLSTVRWLPGAKKAAEQLKAFPYKGRVHALGAAWHYVLLRRTKNFYVDPHGRKYRRDTGWSVDGLLKLSLNSIKPSVGERKYVSI